jgi:hypothetical protein
MPARTISGPFSLLIRHWQPGSAPNFCEAKIASEIIDLPVNVQGNNGQMIEHTIKVTIMRHEAWRKSAS